MQKNYTHTDGPFDIAFKWIKNLFSKAFSSVGRAFLSVFSALVTLGTLKALIDLLKGVQIPNLSQSAKMRNGKAANPGITEKACRTKNCKACYKSTNAELQAA